MFSSPILRNFLKNGPLSKNIVRHFIVVRKSKSKSDLKRYATRTFLGITAGSIVYDGYTEFKICGGIARFLRSLKIAALISVDYSWNLYGLTDGTEIYEKVKLQ